MRRISVTPGMTAGSRVRLASATLLVAACVISTGCGRNDWGFVEGVVTLRGEPVGPGTLIFTPTGPEQTTSAIAHFGEDGRYEVKSPGNKPGAPIGEYRVRVEPGGEEDFGDEQSGPPPDAKIPRQLLGYGANLTATIKKGDNTINLELASQGDS